MGLVGERSGLLGQCGFVWHDDRRDGFGLLGRPLWSQENDRLVFGFVQFVHFFVRFCAKSHAVCHHALYCGRGHRWGDAEFGGDDGGILA